MEKNGSNPNFLSARAILFSMNSKVFETVAFNEERTEFNDTLEVLTEQLRESGSIQDAFYSINLERQCIAVEQFLRPDKLNELNQQLLKSSAAEQGVRFVMDARAYKAQIDKVFIHGITKLPVVSPMKFSYQPRSVILRPPRRTSGRRKRWTFLTPECPT